MKIRSLFALWMGKAVAAILRRRGRRGTSLPGLVAGRLSQSLLPHLLQQLQVCVLVTGTNGKTTTSALLYAMVDSPADPWLTNHAGANLYQGLLAALLAQTDWLGRLRCFKAVLEVDEATMPKVVERFRPTLIVVTNVLRDQLDRYGEVDRALALLRQGVRDPGVTLVTNADDPLASSLGMERELTVFYGFDASQEEGSLRNEVRDGAFCLRCGRELEYSYFIYGQLGNYRCPAGHFERPAPRLSGRLSGSLEETSAMQEVTVQTVAEQTTAGSPPLTYQVSAPIFGLYNHYNLLAAVSAARTLGYSPRTIVAGVKNYRSPLGRMQVFPGNPYCTLTLIKNPTGANSVLRALESHTAAKRICFAINDADADGRDVSWLWDIDIEGFLPQSQSNSFYCAGTRALDMALRLVYAGVPRDAIKVIAELAHIVAETSDDTTPLYVLSTYTALYPLAGYLEARQS